MVDAIVTELAAEVICDSDRPLGIIKQISESGGEFPGVRFAMTRGEKKEAITKMSHGNSPIWWRNNGPLGCPNIPVVPWHSERTGSLCVEIPSR